MEAGGRRQGRWFCKDASERLLDQLLGVHVERGQGVVEDEHRPGEDGPRQGEPLPLPAGERQALLADAGVEAPGEVVDEAGLGDLEGPAMSSSVASAGRG